MERCGRKLDCRRSRRLLSVKSYGCGQGVQEAWRQTGEGRWILSYSYSVGSSEGFLGIGVTSACLRKEGKVLVEKDRLKMWVRETGLW